MRHVNLITNEYIVIIHEMLWKKSGGITFDDVKLEYTNRNKHFVRTPSKVLIDQFGKDQAYVRQLQNHKKYLIEAKDILREILNGHDTDYKEEKSPDDNRVKVFSYPDGMTFNPMEEYLKSTQSPMACLKTLLDSSRGLFSDAWIQDMNLHLLEPVDALTSNRKFIEFDHTDLTNLHLIPELYEHIKCRHVISFQYHPFGKDPYMVTASPFLLHEFNLRWFLFCITLRKGQRRLTTFAVDRMEGNIICQFDKTFLEPECELVQKFKDVVGVSLNENAEAEDIVLNVDPEAIGYIATKPFHHSQRIEGNTVHLHVIINYELETRILEFAHQLSVIAPASLKKRLEDRASSIVKRLRNC